MIVTQREARILELIAQGLTNAAIAQQLNLSDRTITEYITVLLKNSGLKNRTQLASFFLRHRQQITIAVKRNNNTKKQRIIDLLNKGLTIDAIALRLNTTRGYVAKIKSLA